MITPFAVFWLVVGQCLAVAGPPELPDPGQPRPDGIGLKTRFRHYVSLDKMEGRIKALTRDSAWDRMDRLFLGRA